MNKSLTNVARGIVCLMGVAVIIVLVILLPELAREEAVGKVNPPAAYPFLIGAWILSLPIFIALQQTLKLLNQIDENKAFSNQSVITLRKIKYSVIAFAALIVTGAISVIMIARSADPREDVTPVISIGFVFTFVSSLVATFVAVLQRLLQEAINMKKENDLTV